jgi:uncharacterized protein
VKGSNSTTHSLHVLLLVVALLLPAASLVVLGSLWLWEHGFIVHWAIASCIAVTALYYLQKSLILPIRPAKERSAEAGNAAWSSQQSRAWDDVLRLSSTVDPDRMADRDGVLAVAHETISTVAKRLHPERADPLLQFTVPEALAVVERVSASLRKLAIDSFPLGDRITIAQLMWLYRWRGVLSAAEKGYALWRIIRLLNPAAAVTQELRERFSRQLYEAGRKHLAQRLAQAYVKEVGRAAIDLYGGQLRVSAEVAGTHVTSASSRDLDDLKHREAEPVRILVAGQTGAGKSSLVNALASAIEAAVDVLPTTNEFAAYWLRRDDAPAALLIDSPGLTAANAFEPLLAAADNCDMVLWVISAARAARELDRRALAIIRTHFSSAAARSQPPTVIVLTHVDSLRPFGEWSPPYDIASAADSKARSIRAAMDAVSQELGVDMSQIVPVRVDGGATSYNVDALWAKIMEVMPDAQRARLLRTIDDAHGTFSWRTVWSQAVGAGRVIKDTFLSRSLAP